MLLWKELNICEWIVLAEDERALCCMFHSDKKARFPHAERFFYIPPLFSAQHQILQDRVDLEQVLLISLPCYLLVTIVLIRPPTILPCGFVARKCIPEDYAMFLPRRGRPKAILTLQRNNCQWRCWCWLTSAIDPKLATGHHTIRARQ